MSDDRIFRILIVAVLAAGSIIRASYLFSAKKRSRSCRTVRRESGVSMTLQALFYTGGTGLLIVSVAYPRLIAWAGLGLPHSVRWLGVLLGVASLPLLAWVHRWLDLNGSFVARIRENHTLVTGGPYAFVRHPMYAVWYLLHLSLFLMTANWLVGAYFLGVYTLPITLRMNEEEAMLRETFGDAYLSYARRTGRILPRLPRPLS